jgi:hypothetical protein
MLESCDKSRGADTERGPGFSTVQNVQSCAPSPASEAPGTVARIL